jgi:hypothetical protein
MRTQNEEKSTFFIWHFLQRNLKQPCRLMIALCIKQLSCKETVMVLHYSNSMVIHHTDYTTTQMYWIRKITIILKDSYFFTRWILQVLQQSRTAFFPQCLRIATFLQCNTHQHWILKTFLVSRLVLPLCAFYASGPRILFRTKKQIPRFR